MKKLLFTILGIFFISTHSYPYSSSSQTGSIPIYAADTIESPGSYILSNSITGCIKITTSNVNLNLNNFSIFNGNPHGIEIGSGLSQVEIDNGSILNITGGDGLKINPGCGNITLRGLSITGATNGLSASYSHSLIIKDCIASSCSTAGYSLSNCAFCVFFTCAGITNVKGFSFNQSNDLHIYDSAAVANLVAGFYLDTCNRITFKENKTMLNGTGSSGNAFGFYTTNGTCNIFSRCLAEGTTTLATASENIAAGFCFDGTETNSVINECIINNTKTSANDNATAYGVLLRNTLSDLTSEIEYDRTATVKRIKWNKEGSLLTTTGAQANQCEVEIYHFDYYKKELNLIDAIDHGTVVNDLSWTPNSKLLAIVGDANASNFDTSIYEFNTNTQSLTLKDSKAHGATVNSTSWTPYGRFLATAGETASGYEIRLYELNNSSTTLTLRDSIAHGATVNCVAWSPNSKFLAIGGADATGNDIRIYEMHLNTKSLDLHDSKSHGATVNSIAWSPDGKLLAVAGASNTNGKDVALYSFDATTKTLTLVDNKTHGATVHSVTWCKNGDYLAIAGATATDTQVRTYTVNRTAQTISLTKSYIHGNTINSISWSPTGQYIALGGVASNGVTHGIYNTFTGPKKSIIHANAIFNNKGNIHKSSVGISGSSTSNLIIKNMSYDNDINYCFAANVYAESITKQSTNLQNLST